MKNRISSANDYAIANAAGRLPTSAVMSGRKIVPLGINFVGRSIFGPHSVPAAAVFRDSSDGRLFMEPLAPVKIPVVYERIRPSGRT